MIKGHRNRPINIAGTATDVGQTTQTTTAAQTTSLDKLYDRAEQLADVIDQYIQDNGLDGNEDLWRTGQGLKNAATGLGAEVDPTALANQVSQAESMLQQNGITIPVNTEVEPPDESALNLEGSATVTVNADTSSAQSDINSLGGSVTVSVNADVSGAESALSSLSGSENSKFNFQAAAGGESDSPGGTYLVDEIGAELIEHRSRGTYELGTDRGARFTKLDAGDIVHTASETKKILRRGNTMYQGGVVTGRSAWTFNNAANSKQNTSTPYIAGSGDKTGAGKTDYSQDIRNAQQAAAEMAAAYAETADKNAEGAKALLEWVKKLVDWIPTYLNVLKKKTTEFIGAADDAIHYISQNKLIDQAINNVSEEIQANIASVLRYRDFLAQLASKGKLSDDTIYRIQNGTIDINEYEDENTVKAIQTYQQYWEKLVACKDALASLNDQMEALSKQKLDNIVTYFDRIDGLLRDQQKRFESLIDLKKQYGQELTGEDYMNSLTTMEQILTNAQKEEAELLKELEDQLGVGGDIVEAILNGGKEAWDAIAVHVKKGVDEGIEDLQQALAADTEFQRTDEPSKLSKLLEKQQQKIDNSKAIANGETVITSKSAVDDTEITARSAVDDMEITARAVDLSNANIPAAYRARLQRNVDRAQSQGQASSVASSTGNTTQNAGTKHTQAIVTQNEKLVALRPDVDVSVVDVPVEPATQADIVSIGKMLGLDVTSGTAEALKNLEAIKSLFTTSWDNPMAIGSDTWYSYMSTLEDLRESITSTQIEISEMNDTIANIPLTNLKTGYDYLEEIRKNLEDTNQLIDAQGASKYPDTYRSLISVGMKQIENLQEQNKLIEEQMSLLDPLSEKYQELRSDLNSNLDTIADIRENQEEWNDAIIDLQIERLRKQNDVYKEQLRLMQALDDLDKAKQRRLLVYHEDTGFQYEADEDMLENAQEAANDAIYSSIISNLERQKETSNIYGPLGERLVSGSSILDSLGNVLVPVEDKLSEIDFDPYYQSILNGSEQSGLLTSMLNTIDMNKLLEASLGGNVSIDISGMTLNEVNDVRELGDAIINQLPNYLLQALYQKGA